MILVCRKTESTNITKVTKKSSENNSIAYFRIAWRCLLFWLSVDNYLGMLFSGNSPSCATICHWAKAVAISTICQQQTIKAAH